MDTLTAGTIKWPGGAKSPARTQAEVETPTERISQREMDLLRKDGVVDASDAMSLTQMATLLETDSARMASAQAELEAVKNKLGQLRTETIGEIHGVEVTDGFTDEVREKLVAQFEPKVAAAEKAAKRAAEVARRNALLIEQQTASAPANLTDEELAAAASRLPFAKEEVERLTPEQLVERVRWAVQNDNRPALYAYTQVIDRTTADSRLASILRQAELAS